jgi:CHASE1-domain containing sensor protein/two-component sensor histidine kinase
MRQAFGRIMPQVALVAALVLGAAMTLAVYFAEERRVEAEFNRSSDLTVDLITSRLRQHVVVLRAAKGLFSASKGRVARDEFLRFIEEVDIVRDLSGVQGIGFARVFALEDSVKAQAEILGQYGVTVDIRPQTDQTWRVPIVLLEPDNQRNVNALGYDMYAEPVRRAAIDRALTTGEPQMSGPVLLVQETDTDRQTGFLVYLAFGGAPGRTGEGVPFAEGFVYAPFRGGDLIRAALAGAHDLPVGLRITDQAVPELPIYQDEAEADGSLGRVRVVEVLGRQWQFDLWQTGGQTWQRHLGSLLVGLVSVLFAAAAALAIAARQEEAAQARELAAAAARESDYRGLLLQEMKHRIKNHIARIQSIARQSARGATDVKAFTTAFDARLQSMAAVQEILAGTMAAQADLGGILRKELQQCLDTEEVEHLMDGPPVVLDERQAHAFALVAHELVTNALKYGGLSATGDGLKVDWRLDLPKAPDAPPIIQIDWAERFAGAASPEATATGSGFGSRLIEVSLKGELSGTIHRDFSAEGLRITLRFPMSPNLAPEPMAPPSRGRRRH